MAHQNKPEVQMLPGMLGIGIRMGKLETYNEPKFFCSVLGNETREKALQQGEICYTQTKWQSLDNKEIQFNTRVYNSKWEPNIQQNKLHD